jgi:hypothetical protein
LASAGKVSRAAAAIAAVLAATASEAAAQFPDYHLFFDAASVDEKAAKAAQTQIVGAGWRDAYAGLVVDIVRFLPLPRQAESGEVQATMRDPEEGQETGTFLEAGAAQPVSPRARARERLIHFLEERTGQRFGQNLKRWRQWIWSREPEPHPQYLEFKAALYAAVDPRMATFFRPESKAGIRLDEIDWGGVKVNGIPPLDHPKVVPAAEARYLQDKNVVFGLVVNGAARAYPKRVLAWHELVRDRLGEVELAVVYCALCGTVVPYGSEVSGKQLTFGTSGLLYRSNKLMFDEETMSLWSTNEGRPVVGPLVGAGFELRAYPVVTTTWKEWLAAHPDTTVLSLETGFERDYSEGAAYREYFATDRLMFEVPRNDPRLKNKAEVLTLLLRPAGAPREAERKALAVAVDLLRKRPVLHASFAGHELVVVTTEAGANRVYDAGGVRFDRIATDGKQLIDDRGQPWQITEDALIPDGRDEATRRRLPARRAFWFGWHAQFPDTELLK